MKFKDLKLDGLSQDEQIREVRKLLRTEGYYALEDKELDEWIVENHERIIEMSLNGELE